MRLCRIAKRLGALATMLMATMLLAALPAAAERPEIASGDYAYAVRPDGTARITRWTGADASIEVPDALDGLAVTAIGERAFAGSRELTSVVLPEGLTEIGGAAFAGCVSLEAIELPGSVTEVGENPFEGCDSLARIGVSEAQDRLTVADGALLGDGGRRLISYPRASSADSFAIPEGVERIDGGAFYYCNALVSVIVPDSVTAIGSGAFDGRGNLTLTVGRGSFAEAYAAKNGLRFTYPGADGWLEG